MKTGIQFALTLMVLASCNHPSGKPVQITEVKPAPAQLKLVPTSQTNGSAAIACSDFRKIMNEVSKGAVKDAELRQRVHSVYDAVRLATLNSGARKPPDDFGPSAEEMLRSIIEGDRKSFLSAADRFSNACNAQSF